MLFGRVLAYVEKGHVTRDALAEQFASRIEFLASLHGGSDELELFEAYLHVVDFVMALAE